MIFYFPSQQLIGVICFPPHVSPKWEHIGLHTPIASGVVGNSHLIPSQHLMPAMPPHVWSSFLHGGRQASSAPWQDNPSQHLFFSRMEPPHDMLYAIHSGAGVVVGMVGVVGILERQSPSRHSYWGQQNTPVGKVTLHSLAKPRQAGWPSTRFATANVEPKVIDDKIYRIKI